MFGIYRRTPMISSLTTSLTKSLSSLSILNNNIISNSNNIASLCIRKITTSIFNNISHNKYAKLSSLSSSIFSPHLLTSSLSPISLSTTSTSLLGKVNNTCLTTVRFMNRNARRPKKANHGKRPVCHSRRRAKKDVLKSRAYREKIFGFW